MQLAHKIEMKPNKEQAQKLNRACGCARFAYNWGLAKWKELYESWKLDNSQPKPKANSIKKEFNRIKKAQFPWIYESPKDANQQSFANLDQAFKRFFKKKSKFPTFKKKTSRSSFYVSNDKFRIIKNIIVLPKIGEVKLTEELRFKGKIISATVSKNAHKWFVSIQVDTNANKERQTINEVIGIDLGLNHFATLSDGEVVDSPKPLKRYTKLLQKRQRQHSNKVNGSNNRKRSAMKLARLHFKIKCQRHDFIHKLSTKICRENQTICMENLKVKNMMKNHRLARSISDAGWYEFKRQIEYKAKLFGNDVVFADTFYPSSKTCSSCGCINKNLTLKDRVFVCVVCNNEMDRDLNAAVNLSRLGSSRIYACGHVTSVDSVLESASCVDETRITQVYTL
jgi:putative transposase